MKKTVSISIEAEVLALAREEAWRLKKSFSQFVEDTLNLRLMGEPSDDPPSVIEQAAEKLESKIKTKKGPVRANAAMDNFFNPMSKDRQLGKKNGVV